MRQVFEGPFQHVDGFAFATAVRAEAFPISDGVGDPMASWLILSEDGVDLGPAHTAHQLIARDGGGAFSHWNGQLWFSASDNSDPNTNGRRYEAAWNPERYFETRARHALTIVNSWASHLPDGLEAFRNQSVLEIGPGRDMGTVHIIAALGARHVWAIDRFKGAWEANWHDRFLRVLKRVLVGWNPAVDTTAIDHAMAASSLECERITFIGEPFELAGANLRASADLTVSHSVFEHFYSVEDAAVALAAATRPGGRGVHHVDFRDHRNFGTPLEFLLIEDEVYQEPAMNDEYGRGNRIRSQEMQTILEGAGFESVGFVPDQMADPAYLGSVVRRLAKASSRYANADEESLRTLSGAFVLKR